MAEKIQKIIEEISQLTVVELNELIKSLEEKFGVSAVMVAPTVAPSAPETKTEESATVDLILLD